MKAEIGNLTEVWRMRPERTMSGVVSGQRGQFTESSVPVGDYREGGIRPE
ncbi:hypothetical protein CLOSYM_02661 [[Clostridium] symbiosum ATCC 14940]|uniref:Uncharacterized protein n=1 Tax=[Clostridium] symbiosum ATCC 14940 TaxID=411472 RepID=A0ABC9TWV0_CLOSY|nr:hypothetical protein CLOSYM_02661 [[Clostridium] symbiosum ATCC 14940]